MSAVRPDRVLRLAHAAPPQPVVVTMDDAEAASHGDALVLVRPGRVASPAGVPGRRVAVHLAVHGLAVRYLRRLLEQAAESGWDLDCMAAFAAELERRCSYLIVSGARLPILSRDRRWRHGRRAALWRAGRWVSEGGAIEMAVELLADARARDDALLAAMSGAPRGRAARRLAGVLVREGVSARDGGASVVAELGAPWAIEVLALPRLTGEHLRGLRERFAAAPRCEWCGLPVIGAACRRCAPGALR